MGARGRSTVTIYGHCFWIIPLTQLPSPPGIPSLFCVNYHLKTIFFRKSFLGYLSPHWPVTIGEAGAELGSVQRGSRPPHRPPGRETGLPKGERDTREAGERRFNRRQSSQDHAADGRFLNACKKAWAASPSSRWPSLSVFLVAIPAGSTSQVLNFLRKPPNTYLKA